MKNFVHRAGLSLRSWVCRGGGRFRGRSRCGRTFFCGRWCGWPDGPGVDPGVQAFEFFRRKRRVFLAAVERRHFEILDFIRHVLDQRTVVGVTGDDRGLAALAAAA